MVLFRHRSQMIRQHGTSNVKCFQALRIGVDDQIGHGLAGRGHVEIVHRPDRGVVLLHDLFHCPTPFGTIATQASDEANIRLGVLQRFAQTCVCV
jgi:hypothetical protein